MLSKIKAFLTEARQHFREDSFDSVLWIVNLAPRLVGFSVRGESGGAPFWSIHLFLLAYVYGVGSVVYQWKFARSVEDYIKSYINVALVIFIANDGWWFLSKRSEVKDVLKKLALSDQLSQQTEASQKIYKKLLRIIKLIIIGFYSVNYLDECFIYLPHRVDVLNDYALTPCVGLEPLTVSPNKQICLFILCLQECTIATAVLNYQALLLLLIAHTAVMYRILSAEMMSFNEYDDLEEHRVRVKKILPTLVERHGLILCVIDKLKSLYSISLGVNFGSHALCLLLLLYLPIEQGFMFIPIWAYCFSVFFLYCFLCQKLVNASEDFERAVYCCGWENFGLKEKKMVYFMLCQAQKPVEILAADIIPVNIYSFATTLQAMYKFVTVVKF